jgi:hypothetical protein
MPKMLCNCGYVVNYSNIPSEHDYKFISDIEFDKFQGKVDVEELYLTMKIIRKCPKCGRLYVFWNGSGSEPEVYKKEDNEEIIGTT